MEKISENPSLEQIFENFSHHEKNFIKNTIKTFENFFATHPEFALQAFLFPNDVLDSEIRKQWNMNIEYILQNFPHSPHEQERVLEKFYENILRLTEEHPSEAMKTRNAMRWILQKFF